MMEGLTLYRTICAVVIVVITKCILAGAPFSYPADYRKNVNTHLEIETGILTIRQCVQNVVKHKIKDNVVCVRVYVYTIF